MKNSFLLSIALLCSFLSFSQTKTDYESKVTEVIKFLNEKNPEKVYDLFSDDFKSNRKQDEFSDVMKALVNENGSISTAELILEETEAFQYLVEFENSSKLLLLKLSPELKISKFSIEEY